MRLRQIIRVQHRSVCLWHKLKHLQSKLKSMWNPQSSNEHFEQKCWIEPISKNSSSNPGLFKPFKILGRKNSKSFEIIPKSSGHANYTVAVLESLGKIRWIATEVPEQIVRRTVLSAWLQSMHIVRAHRNEFAFSKCATNLFKMFDLTISFALTKIFL